MRRGITADDLAFRMRALLCPEDRAKVNAADRERGLPDLVPTVEGQAALDALPADLVKDQCIYCDETDFDTQYDACEGCREIKGLDGDDE